MKDNSLILALLKTYEDPEPRYADFAIHCTGENGEEIVWCHLLILRLRSEYFRFSANGTFDQVCVTYDH